MSRVKVIENDSLFDPELTAAGEKLVVVDFNASWCGPCKQIAPEYAKLSNKFVDVVFLSVDVQVCVETTDKYNVEAMPTFLFMKSKKVIREVRGAHPQKLVAALEELVKADAEGTLGVEEVPGHGDLKQFIVVAGCNCLNENDDNNNTHKNAFEDNPSVLESDCDEQLMLTIAFNQPVKVHSMKIRAPSDGTGPKTIKLFANQPNQVDFDGGERMEAVQKFVLQPEDVTGEKLIPLRFVKFQNVTNLVMFVVDNQGGDDVTRMEYIKLYGSPCQAANMADFKRVAGKAGEGHNEGHTGL